MRMRRMRRILWGGGEGGVRCHACCTPVELPPDSCIISGLTDEFPVIAQCSQRESEGSGQRAGGNEG
eukprot:2451572-Rhodomonas_salina.1